VEGKKSEEGGKKSDVQKRVLITSPIERTTGNYCSKGKGEEDRKKSYTGPKYGEEKQKNCKRGGMDRVKNPSAKRKKGFSPTQAGKSLG